MACGLVSACYSGHEARARALRVSQVPYASQAEQRRAAEALRAMNRYPLADNALMGLPGLAPEDDAEPEQAETPAGAPEA